MRQNVGSEREANGHAVRQASAGDGRWDGRNRGDGIARQGSHSGGAPVEPLAETLPAWCYRDAEFLELEKEHVFRRNWLLVGHASEVPSPGDYMTLDAVDERILVIRDGEGALRALHNVCRHRASRVVAGERGHCARAMICPYHGWTYNLDGTLRAVPAEASFGSLDKSLYALPAVELDQWMGFVFVRIKPGPGAPLSELMRPFDEELAPYRLSAHRPLQAPWTRTMDVNWKCIHDNDNEGYHVPVGHPGLRRLFGDSYYDESYEHGISRSYSRLREQISPVWSEGLYQRLLPAMEHLPADRQRVWLYFGVFPTFSLAVYPDMAEYFISLPLGPGRTLLRGCAYALPDARRVMRAVRYLNARINRQVQREDDKFCYWTNAGLKSSSYRGGPLSEKEVAVRQFHDRIRRLLPVAHEPHAPAPGQVTRRNAALA